MKINKSKKINNNDTNNDNNTKQLSDLNRNYSNDINILAIIE